MSIKKKKRMMTGILKSTDKELNILRNISINFEDTLNRVNTFLS